MEEDDSPDRRNGSDPANQNNGSRKNSMGNSITMTPPEKGGRDKSQTKAQKQNDKL
jgi:hypothetical protein